MRQKMMNQSKSGAQDEFPEVAEEAWIFFWEEQKLQNQAEGREVRKTTVERRDGEKTAELFQFLIRFQKQINLFGQKTL